MTYEAACFLIGTSDPAKARAMRAQMMAVVHPDLNPNRPEAARLTSLINQAIDMVIVGHGPRNHNQPPRPDAREVTELRAKLRLAEDRLRISQVKVSQSSNRIKKLEKRIEDIQRILNGEMMPPRRPRPNPHRSYYYTPPSSRRWDEDKEDEPDPMY